MSAWKISKTGGYMIKDRVLFVVVFFVIGYGLTVLAVAAWF